MNPRALLTLLATLAALGLLALYMSADEQGAPAAGEAFLPGLADALNDIDQITIVAAGEQTVATLRKDAGRWSVTERSGYPADLGRLRKNLIELSQARIVEQKTANPAFHDRLGVQDINTDTALGNRFDISGGGFEASVIIGQTGISGDNAYVRRAGDPQAYMVSADLSTSPNQVDWLDREILDLPSTRIRAVTITHPDGEVLRVTRSEPDATDMTVQDVPEGRALSYPAVGNSVGAALATLQLDEVMPAENFVPGDASPIIARFETFDGLVVEARTWETGDGRRIAFSAAAEAPQSPAPGVDSAEDSETAEAPDPAAEAARINERLAGWVYTVPGYKAEQFIRRMDDMLQQTGD
jgi:hypothetical protein